MLNFNNKMTNQSVTLYTVLCASTLPFISILIPTILAVAFSEIPTSQVVTVGEEAQFRCQYTGAFGVLWTVNGSSNYPSDISDANTDDGLVNILTIPALPEYNGTLVQCVATVINGSSPFVYFSPTALLIVFMNSSFVSLNGFIEAPSNLTVAQKETATFSCQHMTADSIGWKLNGTAFLNGNLEGVRASSDSLPGGVLNILLVQALPEYNLTTVECVAAFFDEGTQPEISEPVLLTIQGPLEAVSNLRRVSSTITWTPPFSLNLTNIEPDIAYCVEVYNTTCQDEVLLFSDCDVTEPYYVSDTLLEGNTYNITVTPMSNVAGSMRGTPTVKQERFVSLDKSTFINNMPGHNTSNICFLLTVHNIENVIPISYFLSLTPLDGVTSSVSQIQLFSQFYNVSNVVCLEETLPRKRLWNCDVIPYPFCSSTILNVVELSTHDIQNISVTSPQPGEVRVTGDFIDGSTSTGLLVIVYSASNTLYHLVDGTVNLEAVILGLLEGEYEVSVFVVEANGHPFSRAATTPKRITVTASFASLDTEKKINKQLKYELLPNSTGVYVVCKFLEADFITRTTSCVVVVHQRVDQLNSSGLMNIESYVFTRDGDIASGFISGVNLVDYQLGVVRGIRKITDSDVDLSGCSKVCLGTVSGSVLTGIVLIGIIVVISCTIVWKRSRTHEWNDAQASSVTEVPMKRCEAYEVTALARKKVVMEPNLAYEQVCINQCRSVN